VMYYPKPIELRANWEMDVVWDVPEPWGLVIGSQ
jgi:hypothetical protein